MMLCKLAYFANNGFTTLSVKNEGPYTTSQNALM